MDNCYCDNTKGLQHCCGPLLSSQEIAQTAEQLMRSRFSAFKTGNISYLIATHHPSKRKLDDHLAIQETINSYEWLQLVIVNSQHGGPDHNSGKVEFIATFLDKTNSDKSSGTLGQLHEESRFVKENGKWFYLDGIIK